MFNYPKYLQSNTEFYKANLNIRYIPINLKETH